MEIKHAYYTAIRLSLMFAKHIYLTSYHVTINSKKEFTLLTIDAHDSNLC
jgi:hypothetical protein